MGKKIIGGSYSKHRTIFEGFLWKFSSSTNFEVARMSDYLLTLSSHVCVKEMVTTTISLAYYETYSSIMGVQISLTDDYAHSI